MRNQLSIMKIAYLNLRYIFGILCVWGIFGTAYTEWKVEVGPWFRSDMEIKVEGSSQAAEAGVQAARPGRVGSNAEDPLVSNPDNGSQQILRTFENGFVGPSGFPLFRAANQTQYFGYQSASQYDVGSDTLSFTLLRSGTSQGQIQTTSLSTLQQGWSDTAPLDGEGLQTRIGYVLYKKEQLAVLASMQLGWLGNIDKHFQDRLALRQQVERLGFQQDRTERERVIYTYDTLGNPLFPAAPYSQPDPNGIGPLISDTPIAIQTLTSESQNITKRVSRDIRLAESVVDLGMQSDLFMLAMGPSIRIGLNNNVKIVGRLSGTLNYFDASFQRREVFSDQDGQVIGVWSHEDNKEEWLWGGSASIGVEWITQGKMFYALSGGYDWIEDVSFRIGPDEIDLNLSGYRVEASIGWVFGSN